MCLVRHRARWGTWVYNPIVRQSGYTRFNGDTVFSREERNKPILNHELYHDRKSKGPTQSTTQEYKSDEGRLVRDFSHQTGGMCVRIESRTLSSCGKEVIIGQVHKEC